MNSNQRQTAVIRIYSVDAFESKVKELNKKAAKAGAAPITYNIGAEWVKEKVWQRIDGDDVEVVYFYKEVAIYFDEIIYPGGWRLVGVIDHTESLVKSVPGEVEPLVPFLERGAVCDHCRQDRQRNETFVLRGEKGSLVQVGRSCIHLFLGVAIERALNGVGLSSGIGGLEDEQRAGRVVHGYGVVNFLASAATMIRLFGWRSRSAVYNGGVVGAATADLAWSNLEDAGSKSKDKSGVPLWNDPTVEDKATAEAAAKWLKELADSDGLNDYLSNLAQIGRNNFVTSKSAGFAASAIVAYGKKVEEKIKAKQAGVVDEYVCKVGEKVTFNKLSLVKSAGFDTDYGYTFIHRFVDEQGHVIVWRTQTGLDQGDYKVTASVKSHEEYRGEKQTAITRAKTLKLEPVAA